MINKENFKKIKENLVNNKVSINDIKELLENINELNNLKDFETFIKENLKKFTKEIDSKEKLINHKMDLLIEKLI